MKFINLILLSLFLSQLVFSQTMIYDSTGKVTAKVQDERIIDVSTGDIFYTIKGNLIFRGASDKQDDILLLVNTTDIFSKRKTGEVMEKDMNNVKFSVYRGKFYLGEESTTNEYRSIAYFDPQDDGSMILYDAMSETPIGAIQKADLSTGTLVGIFYFFYEKYNLEQLVEQRIRGAEVEEPIPDVSNTGGTIRRLWNTGDDEFEWDGEILRRKWNSFDFEEWTFDGKILQRAWYPGDDEFVWDGHVLKRRWYSSEDEFEWDGSVLKRRWNSDDAFVFQGNVIKRQFGSNPEDEWEIDGDIPIPVIALVVFGLLRK